VASFNTHGAIDRSGNVERNISAFLSVERPPFVGFQEVFFKGQRERLDKGLLGRTRTLVSNNGKTEVLRGQGGAYAHRVASVAASKFNATAGLALYSRFPFTKPRFFEFDGAQVPDKFALKGVLTVEVNLNGFKFILAVTHFHDSANDKVDGRARKANIKTVGQGLAGSSHLPVVLVGDFNIDARARGTGKLDDTLFKELMKTRNRRWLEAGQEFARLNGFAQPPPTVSSGGARIDFMLASPAARRPLVSLAHGTYEVGGDFTSDHRLLRSTLVFT
jgi:endonuclease/exonuclease/phosphatase family metal-dependent hydrolase